METIFHYFFTKPYKISYFTIFHNIGYTTSKSNIISRYWSVILVSVLTTSVIDRDWQEIGLKSSLELSIGSKNTSEDLGSSFYQIKHVRTVFLPNYIDLTNNYFVYRASDNVVRKPRLFYVSTSSYITSISTASICYITSTTTAPLSCSRKKRMITVDGETESEVQPSKSDVDTLQSHEEKDNIEREGRFLVYWITTTSTSYFTSYTTTYSVSSVTCTPIGANICGQLLY